MKKVLTFLLTICICAIINAQQIYNMSFDQWSKQGSSWNPFPKEASEGQRVWDSANRSMKVLGINTTTPEYEHVAVPGPGKAAAKIEVALYDWPKVLRLVTTEGHYDPEADSHLIGRGVLTLAKATDGYVHFEIPIKYRKDANPTYVGISILSSALGEYFTGSSNTVLYVDEFQFNY